MTRMTICRRRYLCLMLALLLLALAGCTPSGKSLGELPSPDAAVLEFFSCMSNGDYSQADTYINNYTTLGFADVQASELSAADLSQTDLASSVSEGDIITNKLIALLRESRSAEIISETDIDGRSAVCHVRVTSIDIRKIEQPLSDNVEARIKELKYRGGIYETSEDIMPIVSQELDKLLYDISPYTVSGEFDIEMIYTERRWKLNISEELYSALVGYMI